MKKIICMLLFSFMVFGDGNITDKMLLDMIKFQNSDKFDENYLLGNLNEDGLSYQMVINFQFLIQVMISIILMMNYILAEYIIN